MHAAIKAYIRINQTHKNDVDLILEFISSDNWNIKEASLEVLGYDKIIPSIKEQDIIIEKCFSFGRNREKKY